VWDTAVTLAEMDALEARATARERDGTNDPFDRWTHEAFAALRDVLRDAVPPERFASLPAQVIHGDFYPPNLLTDGEGRLRAVLDWEFAAVRPRVWDVLRAVAFSFLGVHGETADTAAARRCIAAYRTVQPLPADELAAGVQLYLWRTAHNLNKYRWHDERGPGPTDALAPGDLALTAWLHGQGAAALVRSEEREARNE
jgi:Ser/Thr protein kinase RdoA (MazF antagonist)